MERDMMTLWKIACNERKYPGMWQRWFKNQCVAVGWASQWGYHLRGKTDTGKGWVRARNAIRAMEIGDAVIVTLAGNKFGRIGEITGKAIEDDEWNPLVPPEAGLPDGEVGRRILVRWNLTTGPDDRELVVQAPHEQTLSSGELRPTICRVQSRSLLGIKKIMNDTRNWVRLSGKFGYEKALSDYIATYPHRLEDGLMPHPNKRIREMVFSDKTRLDVMLIDRFDNAVIVECKQHSPSAADVRQLRHYMDELHKDTKQKPRGILVHGGGRILSKEALAEANRPPKVDVYSYRLDVDFLPST